ncbi:hypothetical protein [Mesorhizobium sp. STM 4661]|uniref:hypothetical protein n=1 Tax=Mesorhizobium sp. STM 4661 TaxID=1297570 RepID=UPI0002BE6A90|nr:hypothetical protein [Mesorhizobium sp. STM 4661]CCV13285.1 conserved hypothetical protein [Mesorhizobium sp. STM 4661]
MPSIDFRYNAREHVKQAKEFAASDNEAMLRAACLELRMAIESLVYDLLQTYLAEVSNSVMEKWQPKQVMDELLYIDPNADKTSSISVGLEEKYGVPAKVMKSLGEDKRFRVKWANKAHNALGSYLHEPTISQHRAGLGNLSQKMRKTIEDTVCVLDDVLSSPVFNVNFAVFDEFKCQCGFLIQRKKGFLEGGKILSCISCGMIFEHWFDEKTKNRLCAPKGYSYNCPNPDCGSKQHIWAHKLNTKDEYACQQCGDKIKVVQQYRMERVMTG